MAALRILLCLVTTAAAAAWLPATAQMTAPSAAADPPRGVWLPGSRSYLGLNLGRFRQPLPCGSTALLCDPMERAPTEFFVGTMAGNSWGVEVGYLNTGRLARGLGESREGLSLNLVGKARMGSSVGLFGKVGTTYGRADSPAAGFSGSAVGGQAFGLTYGGGLSLDLSPRLSASLEWENNDFRFAGSGREPVRSTSLGLRFKY